MWFQSILFIVMGQNYGFIVGWQVVCFGKYLLQDYRSNFTRDMMIVGCQIALDVETYDGITVIYSEY